RTRARFAPGGLRRAGYSIVGEHEMRHLFKPREGSMKSSIAVRGLYLLALMALAATVPAFAGPYTFQDWLGWPGQPYTDTIGSKSEVTYVNGPDGIIAKHKFTLVPGGWAGFWQNLSPNNPANLSRARTLKFKIKCTLPGDALVGLYDT